MRVFLTGGTGLIGSHVAERLRARGDDVVALVRPSSGTAHLEALGCELAAGDIMDPPETMAPRMRGCDAVVHAAAKVFESGSRRAFLTLNVDGTERVLRAAGLAAPRVVHVSSVAVYAGIEGGGALTEARWTEADPAGQPAYAASKHLSERAAWRLHREGVVRLTTVRPSVVYGERDRAATPIFVRFARLPLTPLPAGGRTTMPVVYAGNVAAGVIAALDREQAVGRAYNLALDEPVTGRELLGRVAEGLGRKARIVALPAPLVMGVAAAVDGLGRVLPVASPGGARRGARLLMRDNPYDSHRARLELGWTQLVTHAEGMRRTMEWWQSREAE